MYNILLKCQILLRLHLAYLLSTNVLHFYKFCSVQYFRFNIVQSCLFDNTLVCLPTGLGKTFIAAVVMYNFYRWYPQVIFRYMLAG